METEETNDNQEEEETSDDIDDIDEEPLEEKSEDEKPSAKTSTKTYSEREKRLYARMKKAEAEAKALKDSLGKKEGIKEGTPASQENDVFDLAKAISSLKEYTPEELDFIKIISKSKGISPQEAAKTEEAKLYIAARREKVEEESKTLEPSTKQSLSEKSVSDVTPEDLKNMSISEKEAFLEKIGWGSKPYKKRKD